MSAEAVAFALLNDSSITSLTGGKVWLVDLPQEWSLPGVAFMVVSGVPQPVVAYQNGAQRLRARVQVTILAETADEIVRIRAAVRARMDFLHSTVVGGFTVMSSRVDLIGPVLPNRETGVYTQSIDFSITFYE